MRPPSRRSATLVVLALLACGACATDRAEPAPVPPAGSTAWQLPADWADVEPLAFESLLDRELPRGRTTELDAATLETLAAALERQGPGAVRAAAILARSGTLAGREHLLARLEQRVEGPERASDAGDVVAAAALARAAGLEDEQREELADRLAALAVGSRPHPDLEVRVECAVSALALGDDDPIPFLLQVLRIGTWDGLEDPLPFDPGMTTAWVRGRAALALSQRAGVPNPYRTEASIADRQEAAAKLEELLEEE